MQRPTMPRLDTILVAVDFTGPSMAAAEWAARSFAPDARIVLLNVIEPPPDPPSLAHRFPSTHNLVQSTRAEAERKLLDLVDRVAPGRASVEIRVGRPHEQLLALATERAADMVVLGRQDLGAGGWARVGSVAQRVLRNSRIPVLVAAGSVAGAPRDVLAAVDDSPMADVVLGWARFIGERFSSKATAISVLPSGSTAAVEDAGAWLEQRIELAGAAASVQSRIVFPFGRPAEGIVAEARTMGSRLIVIGSRGAGASDSSFGSVAESVVVSAPCPVLVVLP